MQNGLSCRYHASCIVQRLVQQRATWRPPHSLSVVVLLGVLVHVVVLLVAVAAAGRAHDLVLLHLDRLGRRGRVVHRRRGWVVHRRGRRRRRLVHGRRRRVVLLGVVLGLVVDGLVVDGLVLGWWRRRLVLGRRRRRRRLVLGWRRRHLVLGRRRRHLVLGRWRRLLVHLLLLHLFLLGKEIPPRVGALGDRRECDEREKRDGERALADRHHGWWFWLCVVNATRDQG